MKRKLLSFIIPFIGFTSLKAQIVDTVSLGSGYSNQKWYSLTSDEKGSSAKNNWDIAFDCSNYGSSIRINSIIGTTLWKYPTNTISGWSTVDTTGLSTWSKLNNSDTSWAVGAFDKGIDSNNPMDLGWGIYNSTTHIVTGDSLYIIKLSDTTYRKLWIKSLSAGNFTFKFAKIDGSDSSEVTFAKSNYSGKAFGYYSLRSKMEVDREPKSADWDFTFCQYTAFIPNAYTVSGILTNSGTRVAQVNNVGNSTTFKDWETQTYSTVINEIGYDWKSFNGTEYIFADSTVYFVKTNAGDVWKIIPTGFGGGSTGNFIFTKEKIASAGLYDLDGKTTTLFSIYPNPSSSGNVTIIYDFEKNVRVAKLTIIDVTGKNIATTDLTNTVGLHTHLLETNTMKAGIYFVSLEVDGEKIQQKLILE